MADGAQSAGSRHVGRGIICALLGGIFWGFSGTCAQLLMGQFGVPALWITCVRLAIAAAVFLPLAMLLDRRGLRAVLRDRRSLVQIAAFAVFGVVLTQVSYLLSIQSTNAGTGTVLQQLGLVIIMAYTCVRARRAPRVREVAGLAFALAGVLVIATQGNPSSLSISPAGLFWGLVTACGLACYTLVPARVLEKWGSMVVTGLAMLVGGVAMSAAVRPWSIEVELSPEALAALAALVLVGTFLAYLLYLQGVKDAGPVRAGLLCSVEPVSATVIGVVWLRNPVSLWDVLGCVFVLIMIFLVTGSGKDEAPAEPSDEAEGGLLDDPPLFAGRASVLGYYASRPARRADFERVSALLERTRAGLAARGIVEKGKRYPSSRRLMRSIKEGTTHVVENADGALIAVFALSFSSDKNYRRGIEGAWRTSSDASEQGACGAAEGELSRTCGYAVLRWVSVEPAARRRGVGMFLLDKVDGLARSAHRASVRTDIDEANEPMRLLLEKHGYAFCGTVTIKDALGRTKRHAAYERLL